MSGGPLSGWRSWLTRPRAGVAADPPRAGLSNADLLAQWDAGDRILTCRMADLGPVYEQAIHEIGMEMLRAMLADPFDFRAFAAPDERAAFALWQAYSSRILETAGVRAALERLAPESLQISAAMNVAGMFARNGYAAEMARVPEARRILLAKAPRSGA